MFHVVCSLKHSKIMDYMERIFHLKARKRREKGYLDCKGETLKNKHLGILVTL